MLFFIKVYCNPENACTQAAIGFFIVKYEILRLYPNGLRFLTAKCKILKTVPKRPFVFHSKIRNLIMYPNCHSFFDYKIRNFKVVSKQSRSFNNKFKNLKLYLNFHSFFDDVFKIWSHTQTAICFFLLKTRKIELKCYVCCLSLSITYLVTKLLLRNDYR